VAARAATAAELAAQRRATAEAFYRDQGLAPHRIEGHLKGIDFSQPVEVVTLPKGTTVSQFQVPGNPQGMYYAPAGSTPSSLGISPQGLNGAGQVVDKVATPFVTQQDVRVLRSTAAGITDTWSVPGQAIKSAGGATQYVSADKAAFLPLGP
jgi:hypothetical protein